MNSTNPATNGESESPGNEETEAGPQFIRITTHGKMNAWIKFALEFLDTNPDRPLVLHTLPAEPRPQQRGDSKPPATAAKADTLSSKPKQNVTVVVPRLISVVEIIKRAYIKSLEDRKSPILAGLHQYNEIGCLEDSKPVQTEETISEEQRAVQITNALQGVNHPKQTQTPFMRVTLSRSLVPELDKEGVTYQPPTIRKLSKSARARAKKRARKSIDEDTRGAGEKADAEVAQQEDMVVA